MLSLIFDVIFILGAVPTATCLQTKMPIEETQNYDE